MMEVDIEQYLTSHRCHKPNLNKGLVTTFSASILINRKMYPSIPELYKERALREREREREREYLFKKKKD